MTDLIVDAEFQDPAQKNCPSRGHKKIARHFRR